MSPENINDFFSPVSTGTNPHQKIDDLILMAELDKIAKENTMYGAMTQFNPEDWTHGTGGLGLLEWADTGPIIGMKALAGLVGKGGKGLSKLHKTAKNIFGTTNNLKETRFILDDGSYLDFSLKSADGTKITSGWTHFNEDDIARVGWDDMVTHGSKEFGEMNRHKFVESGAINWRHEENALKIGAKPSYDQLNTLKKIFKEVSGRTKDEQWLATGSVAPVMRMHMQDIKNARETEAALNLESIKWKDIEEMLNNFYSGKELGGTKRLLNK
jgi:hypothetical protein